MRLQAFGLVGALAIIGLLAGADHAHAGGGCGGRGGSYRGGGSWGGHTFGQSGYSGSGYSGSGMSCCSMGGMNMNMGSMPMAPAPTYYGAMPMNGYAAPAPAPVAGAARYTCPMHPGVVSATPGSCPYCGMALTRR